MTIVEGLLLGVVYVLPPGPVTIETVRRGLQGGSTPLWPCKWALWVAI